MGVRALLSKLRAHVRNRTLGERLARESRRWTSPLETLAGIRARRLEEGWKAVDGTPGCIDVGLIGGGRLRLHGDGSLGRYICCESFEAAECVFLDRFLRRGDVFVDVGANLGLFTIAAAKRVGPSGLVLAFEPGQQARRRLLENLEINDLRNVRVFPFALSDSAGSATLSVPGAGLDAYGSLAAPIIEAVGACEVVEMRTWNEIAPECLGSRDVTMMKIDVEGWEARVLGGAATSLSGPKAPLLQVEFTEAAAQNAGSSCVRLYELLSGLGFTICRFDVESGRLEPEGIRQAYPYVNLYATKDLCRANERLDARRPQLSASKKSLGQVYRLLRVHRTAVKSA